MKAESQPKGLSSVLPPSSSAAAVEKLEAAAKAAQNGDGWHRNFAAALAANPSAYDQYLAANPAQTRDN